MAISLSSLNNKALGDITGSEKIPVSGAGDPSVTPNLLSSYINRATVVNVEYGSSDDQTSVIQAAVDAATAGDTLVFGGGVVKVETTITIGKKLTIIGNFNTVFQTTSNIAMFTMDNADDFTIFGCDFLGSGESSGSTNQRGIYTLNSQGFRVSNCRFQDFGGAGVQITESTGGNFVMGSIVECRAVDCLTGFELTSTGTYNTISSCGANHCTVGYRIASPNNTIQGSHATVCGTGLLIESEQGAGAGKLSVVGGQFNHNTASINVSALDGTNAAFFTGVEMLANSSLSVNDDKVFFMNCDIDCSTINLNDVNVHFTQCLVHGTPTVNDDTNTTWVNCYADDNSAFTG